MTILRMLLKILADHHARMSPDDFTERQIANRRLWEDMLSVEGFFAHFDWREAVRDANSNSVRQRDDGGLELSYNPIQRIITVRSSESSHASSCLCDRLTFPVRVVIEITSQCNSQMHTVHRRKSRDFTHSAPGRSYN